MILIKKYLLFALNLILVLTLCFASQGSVSALSKSQALDEEITAPLYSGLSWTNIGKVQKEVHAYGRILNFDGDAFEALASFPDKNPESIFEYYSSENLQSLGWTFVGGVGVELTYQHVSERYLTVQIENCPNSETDYCLSVWVSTKFIGTPDITAPMPDPVGYNKTTPANGATINMSNLTATYMLLQWTDALIADTDRYQYCIDETNNNSCDSSWIERNSLYSGGPSEFPLVSGHKYYWQVRTRDTGIYANGGVWWSFTVVKTTVSFNKTAPVNGSTIAMPATTYQLLQWTDAGLPDTDRYQYCIDETNNNSCDSSWIERNSLYSGGPGEFPLAYGHTYYWQVKARDANVYANSGTWWSFKIQSILAAPTVTSIVRNTPTSASTNAAAVVFAVNFDQAVTGVDITDFSLTTTGVVGANIASVTGADNTAIRTVTVNTGTGAGTIRLNLIDDDSIKNSQTTPLGGVGASNGNFITGEVYTIDRAAPTVSSVGAPATTITPGIITFTVTFSEPVTGVNTTDFALVITDSVNGASITSVTGTSPTAIYTVTVHTGGVGSGTIQLNVVDDDTIKDVATNPLGGVGAGNGNFAGTIFTKSTFADVPESGSPWSPYWSYIESVYDAGITNGCGSGYYCPASTVTRAQMAVFLLRGIHGSAYSPPAATGTVFLDVPTSAFAADWIEELTAEGITSGCGAGNYCPNSTITRAQMAVFLLRAKHGSAYNPPAATGTAFADVAIDSFAAAWIEQLAAEGVTSGCTPGNYCPNDAVTRAQMAVFLQRTFGLP